jgi:hypothetical protein
MPNELNEMICAATSTSYSYPFFIVFVRPAIISKVYRRQRTDFNQVIDAVVGV